MTCSNCGDQLIKGATFCAACGTLVNATTAPAPVAVQPAAVQAEAQPNNKLRFWGRNRSIGGWALSLTIISLVLPTPLVGLAAVVLSVIALRKKEQYALYTLIVSVLIILWHQFGFFVLSWIH
mgnify:CR=1 FL=1